MRYDIRGTWRGRPVEVRWESGRFSGPDDLVTELRIRVDRSSVLDPHRPDDALVLMHQVMDSIDVVAFEGDEPGLEWRVGDTRSKRRR